MPGSVPGAHGRARPRAAALGRRRSRHPNNIILIFLRTCAAASYGTQRPTMAARWYFLRRLRPRLLRVGPT